MKKLYFLFSLLLTTVAGFAQQIIAQTTSQSVPVYLLRKESSPLLETLNNDVLLYAELTHFALVKVKFYKASQAAWTEGFVAQDQLRYISSANDAEKSEILTQFLRRYLQGEVLRNTLPLPSYNLIIDMCLEQSCEQQNTVLARLFLESLFLRYESLDDKQIFAIEELYQCQKSIVDAALSNEKSTFVKEKIQAIIHNL